MKARAAAAKADAAPAKPRSRPAGASSPKAPSRVAMPRGRRHVPARSAGTATRIAGLDALRAIAIVAMVVYHFCFDLRYFGITRWDFEHDTGWLTARALILSAFLLIAGISAVLAQRERKPLAHWLRHIGVIAFAALLVSAGSFVTFRQSFIWFGVLHAIALSLLLAKPLLGRPRLAALAGAAIIVAGITYTNPAFDNRALGWIGFMTSKPVTEDYVPLFPWMGVLLLGVTLGHVLVATRFTALAPLAHLPSPLRFLGRHSLAAYLLHQPLLFGVLWLVAG